MIICEKLVNMFICLSRRLQRIRPGRGVTTMDPVESSASSASPSGTWYMRTPPRSIEGEDTLSPYDDNSHSLPQLFDKTTGEPGLQMTCNAEIFAAEFSTGHSEEEELVMVRALSQVQVRNLSNLLDRVGNMSQSARSQARNGKVRMLKDQMDRTGYALDQAFESILGIVTT